MPGRDAVAKCAAISPAAIVGRSRSNVRISRRVGSAIAVKASLLLNDSPECLEMLVVPPSLVAFKLSTSGLAQPLEAVMEDLDHRAVVRRCEAQRPQRGDAPRQRRVMPVAFEGDFTNGLQDCDGAAVVLATAIQ